MADVEKVIYGLRCIAWIEPAPLCENCAYKKNQGGFSCKRQCAKDAIELLAKKQNKAHWIPYDRTGTNNFDDYKCSNCGCIVPYESNYCPDCGTQIEKQKHF